MTFPGLLIVILNAHNLYAQQTIFRNVDHWQFEIKCHGYSASKVFKVHNFKEYEIYENIQLCLKY